MNKTTERKTVTPQRNLCAPYQGGALIKGAPVERSGHALAVYVAGPTSQHAFVRRMADAIASAPGLFVCSRWDVRAAEILASQEGRDSWARGDVRAQMFRDNAREMRAADQAVIITSRDTPRATYSEAGWFCAAGRPLTFVSSSHVDAGIFSDWEAARIVEDPNPTGYTVSGRRVSDIEGYEAELFARVILSIKSFARRYP